MKWYESFVNKFYARKFIYLRNNIINLNTTVDLNRFHNDMVNLALFTLVSRQTLLQPIKSTRIIELTNHTVSLKTYLVQADLAAIVTELSNLYSTLNRFFNGALSGGVI